MDADQAAIVGTRPLGDSGLDDPTINPHHVRFLRIATPAAGTMGIEGVTDVHVGAA